MSRFTTFIEMISRCPPLVAPLRMLSLFRRGLFVGRARSFKPVPHQLDVFPESETMGDRLTLTLTPTLTLTLDLDLDLALKVCVAACSCSTLIS